MHISTINNISYAKSNDYTQSNATRNCCPKPKRDVVTFSGKQITEELTPDEKKRKMILIDKIERRENPGVRPQYIMPYYAQFITKETLPYAEELEKTDIVYSAIMDDALRKDSFIDMVKFVTANSNKGYDKRAMALFSHAYSKANKDFFADKNAVNNLQKKLSIYLDKINSDNLYDVEYRTQDVLLAINPNTAPVLKALCKRDEYSFENIRTVMKKLTVGLSYNDEEKDILKARTKFIISALGKASPETIAKTVPQINSKNIAKIATSLVGKLPNGAENLPNIIIAANLVQNYGAGKVKLSVVG